jgi:molecular chaperone DnaJ
MQKDYYLVLGVSRGADLNKIKKAYRSVVKKYHPDVSNEEDSSARFMEIKEAYDTLSDHEKKNKYDDRLRNQTSAYRVNRVHEETRERISRFRNMESDFFTKTDDFFEGFIPGFYDKDKGNLHNKDLYFDAILTPDEAAAGGLYPITVPVMLSCPVCSRSGLWEGLFCPLCDGSGRISAEKKFALSIPPNVSGGTEISLSLEGIGLKDMYLHVRVSIDGYL